MRMLCLGDVHILVDLEGNAPLGVGLGVGDNQGNHGLPPTPFGLQVGFAMRHYKAAVVFGPFQIQRACNDDLKLIGFGVNLGEGWPILFGRQANPIYLPTEGLGSGCLQKNFHPLFFQGFAKRPQGVGEGLSSGDDNGLGRLLHGVLHNRFYGNRRE